MAGRTMTAGFRAAALVACAAMLAAGRGASADASSQAGTRPASGTVTVDVGVVDRTGAPVSDVTPGEFQATIDGKARRVAAARFVEARRVAAAPPAAAARFDVEAAMAATYASNQATASPTPEEPAGRSLLVAVDLGTFPPTASPSLVTSVGELLDALGPAGAGLVAFPSSGVTVLPPAGRERVRNALARLAGKAEAAPRPQSGVSLREALDVARGGPRELSRVAERVCGSGASLDAEVGRLVGLGTCQQQIQADVPMLTDYARRVSLASLLEIGNTMRMTAALPGPKALILVSGGLVSGEYASTLGIQEEVRKLAELAAATQVSLYAVYAEPDQFDAGSLDRQRPSVVVQGESELRLAGLQHVAGAAGGFAFKLTVGTSAVFERVAREVAGHYVLEVETEPVDRDGRARGLKVRVGRPDTTVRAREQILVPRDRGAKTGDEAVLSALKGVAVEHDLPISLSAQAMRDASPGRVRLLINARIGARVPGPGRVRVAYSIRGAAGSVADSGAEWRDLPVSGSDEAAAWLFNETVIVNPGRYTIRLAAADSQGTLGTIDHQLSAELFAGDGGPLADPVLVDPSRVAASVLSPLTDGRVWSDRVEVYLEWYPVAGRTPTSARFEVAERVDAQPLTSAGAVVAGADDGRRWTARGGVDLTMVPPGAYLLLGRVFEGTRLVGTSVRPFRFEGALFSAGGPRLPFSLASAGALVSQFRREQVLRPDAVGFFLGRLAATESGALPPALAQASEAARAGQFEAVLSQVGDVSDPPLTAAFLRGLALYAAGDLETAGDQFRAALRASNDFLPAAFYLGACYAAGGRDREAVGAWQTSLVSESDARIVYDVLADGWLRLREGARAEAILREAMERWPEDASFVPRLAAAMAAQGRRNEALDALRPYLDGHPRDTDALFLGVRLLYDAYSAGKAVKTGPEDAAQAAAWAAGYREAQGPNQALVDRWALFVRQKGEGRK